ncbi:MAG: hypothetical protein WAL04_16320 [Acidimicrobiales bacterium]|jgi:hypothetical protein
MKDREVLDHTAPMDVQEAALIDRDSRKRALNELRVSTPLLFLVHGLVFFLAYGALWLSVRDQHPYRGPTGPAWGAVVVVVFIGVMTRIAIISRPIEGVRGRSVVQAAILGMALPLGLTALWVEAAALDHSGASRPLVFMLAFAAPPLVLGLVFLAMSAVQADWSVLAVGVWLLAVAAGGAWAGPETVLAVYALGCGGGCLLAAAVRRWLLRS